MDGGDGEGRDGASSGKRMGYKPKKLEEEL